MRVRLQELAEYKQESTELKNQVGCGGGGERGTLRHTLEPSSARIVLPCIRCGAVRSCAAWRPLLRRVQGFTIRRLEERARELEAQLEEKVPLLGGRVLGCSSAGVGRLGRPGLPACLVHAPGSCQLLLVAPCLLPGCRALQDRQLAEQQKSAEAEMQERLVA